MVNKFISNQSCWNQYNFHIVASVEIIKVDVQFFFSFKFHKRIFCEYTKTSQYASSYTIQLEIYFLFHKLVNKNVS